MIILGINAYHGDSSACILKDGVLLAAAEEERFLRIKHWAGFPSEAVRYCLREAGIDIGGVDHIAVNRNPGANFWRKAVFSVLSRPSPTAIAGRAKNMLRIRGLPGVFAEKLNVDPERLRARMHFIEHHRAHMASAFFVSPFESSAVLSVDGFGDFVSTMWGSGSGSRIAVDGQVTFPHSLGLFYLAMTQYLGFKNYGDEYKVMGLAAYGRPDELAKMRRLIRLKKGGRFELNLDYFIHHKEGTTMSWNDTAPSISDCYSEKLAELLGPARKPDEPVAEMHRHIAASTQALYEEVFFHVLDEVYKKTRSSRLCLAGGCGFNSVANGKVAMKTPFRDVYVQAAAGDAGGALGAAYYVWNSVLGRKRSFVMDRADWGPEYGDAEIDKLLSAKSGEFKGCSVERVPDAERRCRKAAQAVADGKVVGWFQGRMEWGPRALGNRSILGDPRRPDMKDILNLKIKHRESFRPFAPSVLREAAGEWFERESDVPFMTHVYPIRPEKRPLIPAVTHVDGSGRLQTVSRESSPLYHGLISQFRALTGIPMVLNTSFNDNEPIVCRPEEALDCFLRTRMDMLVLGSLVIARREP